MVLGKLPVPERPTTWIIVGQILLCFSRCGWGLFGHFSPVTSLFFLPLSGGWSGGAMVLGKLPVPGRPTNLDYSRARAYCACSGCGWGLFGHFFSRLSFLFSFSLSLGDGLI